MTRPRPTLAPTGKPTPRLAECRDCHDPIRFVQMTSGTWLPVNPTANPSGTVTARPVGGVLTGYVISKERPHDGVSDRYRPHAATCSSRQHPERETAAADQPPTLFD